MSWFEKLFINEAEAALNSQGAPSDEQVSSAVDAYLEENPIVCSEEHPITYLKSPDDNNNIRYIRNLDSGVYIFNGSFAPHNGSAVTYTYSSDTLVNVLNNGSVTHVQIFHTKDNTIQYLEITDDSVSSNDVNQGDIEVSTNKITAIDDNADDDHYPSAKAVKEYVDEVLGVIENGSY